MKTSDISTARLNNRFINCNLGKKLNLISCRNTAIIKDWRILTLQKPCQLCYFSLSEICLWSTIFLQKKKQLLTNQPFCNQNHPGLIEIWKQGQSKCPQGLQEVRGDAAPQVGSSAGTNPSWPEGWDLLESHQWFVFLFFFFLFGLLHV